MVDGVVRVQDSRFRNVVIKKPVVITGFFIEGKKKRAEMFSAVLSV